MTNEIKNETDPVTTTPAEAQNTVAVTEMAIPIARFNEVNNRLKAMVAAQEGEAKAREKAETAALVEQNKFQELYNAATLQAKVDNEELAQLRASDLKNTAVLTALWESKATLVPELYRSLVEALPLPDRLDWIARNESHIAKPAGGTPSNQAGTGNGQTARNSYSGPPVKF